MTTHHGTMGQAGFIERNGLWREEDLEAADRVRHLVVENQTEMIRLSFADQHGILRGKSIAVGELDQAFSGGCAMTTNLLFKDTAHRTVYAVWEPGAGVGRDEFSGARDFIMVPDPATFHVLPWADKTGWMMCDIYHSDGRPIPYSTRQIGRDAVAKLADAGYDYLCGLEVEFHILKLEDPKLRPGQAGQPGEPPDVSLLTHGYQYLTEFRMDELEPVVEIIRRDVLDLGLPLRSIEVEYGPSQCEFTFQPRMGIESADNMILFRSAVKQICRRRGYHGTFMCRPQVKDLFSSGWHLHQSLYDRRTLENIFMPQTEGEILSPTGRHYVAGLLDHAAAACVFTTPTINGYKRYQPYSLAPERAHWAYDNKGAMVRALGGPGDPGSRVENRIGEPAANPYLYLASQMISGLDGIKRGLEPPPPDETPYRSEAPRLPASLMDSLSALRASELFRSELGDDFVDYILTLKEAEVSRFLSEVTDWEQREYFEIF